jgi:RNA polymerase sigma factor (sigma-70 family)
MSDKPQDAGPPDAKQQELAELLQRHRGALARFFEREAQGLMKRETVDDLVQGTHMRALRQADQFTFRGEREFLAWLQIIARQHIGDRRDHWVALRRDAGSVLRITTSPASSMGGASQTSGVNPAANMAGPSTFAMRREMVGLAAKAITCLLPRDQEIVRAVCAGATNVELAAKLGIEYDAAEKAKNRALERFRKTFELMTRGNP